MMGFIDNALKWLGFREEKRDLNSDNFYTGATITPFESNADAALHLMPVYAAVGLIADSLAMLAARLYRGEDDLAQRVDMPDWLRRPDYRVTWFDWVHQLAASLLLRGNAYGYVMRSASGQILGVRWIHPRHVVVNEKYVDNPEYIIGGEPYSAWEIGGDILHIRAFTLPGSVLGLSPVALFQTQFETARSAVEFGHEWFDNPVPAGILKNEKSTLTQEQMTEAKARFKASIKRGEPVALDMNWSWQQVSLSPEQAQFLATIKASATQIAAIFRVDPEDIGGELSGGSLRYTTLEGNQRKFNTRTLLAWVVRIQQGVEPLLPPGFHLRLDLDSTAQPSLLERAKTDTERLRNGTRTLAEARTANGEKPLSAEDIAFWQEHYNTQKTASESVAKSISTSITEGP